MANVLSLQIQMNQVRVVLNHKSSQIYRFQDLWRVGGKHGRQNGRSLHEHRLWDFSACLENQKNTGMVDWRPNFRNGCFKVHPVKNYPWHGQVAIPIIESAIIVKNLRSDHPRIGLRTPIFFLPLVKGKFSIRPRNSKISGESGPFVR